MKITKALGCEIIVKEYKPKSPVNIFLYKIDHFKETGEVEREKCHAIAGEVVFVGRGYRCENGEITPLEVKVGDKVVFYYLDNSKIEIQGKEYWLIEENNIWFVFED